MVILTNPMFELWVRFTYIQIVYETQFTSKKYIGTQPTRIRSEDIQT